MVYSKTYNLESHYLQCSIKCNITLKEAHISQFSPIEGEFPSELHNTYDVCLLKVHKRMLQKGSLMINVLV